MLLLRAVPRAVPLALVPLLLVPPAGAAPTATLVLDPVRPAAGATECVAMTVTARDAVGAVPSDTATVTVTVSATGTATTSFCDPDTGGDVGEAGPTATREVVPAGAPAVARFGVTSPVRGPVAIVAVAGAVRSATATASFGPPPLPPCGPAPGLALTSPVVPAGTAGELTATGTPGTELQLHAATAPTTTYRRVRTALVPADGRVTWSVQPSGSTRLYAVQQGCTDLSGLLVLGARSPVTLAATRVARLRYRFSGSTGGAPAGTPVELLRRTPTGHVLLARTSTTAGGRWSLERRFTSPVRLVVVARTATTATRVSGTSPALPTAVA